jgi:SAM-dependent methyltransferase
VASQAERASSFGAIADDYDRLRPSPPDDAIRWLLPADCVTAVDLAAGTGLVSRAAAAHAERVVAIEPDPRMAAVLRTHSAGVAVLRGVGEAIPLANGSADAVLISSAWHWLDPSRAIPELARVLREGGRLCVLRTGFDRDTWWLRELRRQRPDPDRDRQLRDGSGRYETLPTTGQFGNVAQESFTFTRPMTAEDFTGLLATYSAVITASEQDRAADLAWVRSELDRLFPGADTIEVPMRSSCWRADRVALHANLSCHVLHAQFAVRDELAVVVGDVDAP